MIFCCSSLSKWIHFLWGHWLETIVCPEDRLLPHPTPTSTKPHNGTTEFCLGWRVKNHLILEINTVSYLGPTLSRSALEHRCSSQSFPYCLSWAMVKSRSRWLMHWHNVRDINKFKVRDKAFSLLLFPLYFQLSAENRTITYYLIFDINTL